LPHLPCHAARLTLAAERPGRVTFAGADILDRPLQERFRRSVADVRDERRIAAGLTVEESLRLGILAAKGERASRRVATGRIKVIAEIFPRLKQRLKQEAVTISGREQQRLTIARALMANPVMMLLDETSEVILPILVGSMFPSRWNERAPRYGYSLVGQGNGGMAGFAKGRRGGRRRDGPD
jgi:branched-chain amino acid transport system ATP-binding protein